MNDQLNLSHRPLRITEVAAQQILDSRGFPTVQVDLRLEHGDVVRSSTPAGASTGANEAIELRDDDAGYSGRTVHTAVAGIRGELAELLISKEWNSIGELDHAMRELDATPSLARLGGNAVVALSMGGPTRKKRP